MARPASEDRIEVVEGVYVYLRNSDVWQVYFKLDGEKKAVRQSLKTSDLSKAKKLALEKYDQARLRQLSGKPQHGISFDVLCEEYLSSKPNGSSKKYHQETIDRHLSPYFASRLADFSEITNADVLDYIKWRRAKGGRGDGELKPQTLNRENVVLRQLIKFAVTKGYVAKDDAPDVEHFKASNNRRKNFTRNEIDTLIHTAKARVDETENAATKEQRQLLHDWIVVLVNTGLRTGEAAALRWSDVFLDLDEPYLHIRKGKTKPRDVVPLDPAVDCLKDIRTRLKAFLAENKKQLAKDQLVFSICNREQKSLVPVKEFKTSFNNLLEACSLFDTDPELRRSPYSLRHSYATMRIEDGTNIYVLKDQMGTSVKMIEQHYGHVITREQRDELTKTRDKAAQKNSGNAVTSDELNVLIGALNKDKADTVVDVVRQQILKEWVAENGREPDPTTPGDEEIFEGLVYSALRKLGHGELYEPPDELPDSLPD